MSNGHSFGMSQPSKSAVRSETFTDLVLAMFRASNLTLAWGDRIVGPLGLTSARWQILGAIAAADHPKPVSALARDLGANRQNVQRIVNLLDRDGLTQFEVNPRHRRAQLVLLTAKGSQAYRDALAAYFPQAERMAERFSLDELQIARRVMDGLVVKLGGADHEEQD